LSSLADRIRGIVAPSGAAQGVSPADAGLKACATSNAEGLLGGAWLDGTFVVDRRWDPSAHHGTERIGALAERLERSAAEAPFFTGGAPARPPFMFFDLETTGLSGGAGTLAFLVGCAWFDDDGAFVTRQFLLARHADERMLLEAVAAELGRAGALVSFNGKSFDAPLLESRYLFHRLSWSGREMPHLDVLHPARRFWKRKASTLSDESSCSLVALEKQLVGLRRRGDVPGFDIPGRYFQFVRSGDAAPLQAVLEHNRLDLLTLAALTARLLHLTRSGPDAISDPREALALGYVYARGHRQGQGGLSEANDAALEARARASFRRAIDRCRSPRGAYDPIRIDALRALALACRRARQHEQAARLWSELVETRGCPPAVVREATEALAIHHEHRVRDLVSAKRFALGSLAALTGGPRPSLAEAMRHRLARIERKIGKSEGRSLKYELKFEVEA
jgi:uncharacterized protein YprB with RNaseH-like and TPR domain